MKNRKPMVRVLKNRWGNYVCFIGGRQDFFTGAEFDAQSWLDERMSSGMYDLSPSSDLKSTNIGGVAK